MGLNDQQSQALQTLLAFVEGEEGSFSLQGGAGVGKTYLVGVLVKELMARGHRVLIAAPTHKACRVLRSKLDSWGVRWEFKPQREVPAGVAIVDTTAALLGIRPVIDEDQDENEVKFKPSGNGSIARLFEVDFGKPAVLLIDEVSMLGRDDLVQLIDYLHGRGKLIAVGDEGQLPPVKKQTIEFAQDFDGSFTLDKVVRQAEGSAIVSLAWAIRRDEELQPLLDGIDLLGSGVERSANVSRDFLEQVEAPVDDETKRSVYIAYRNAVVQQVQEHACQKIYGHGALDFEKGELVVASSPGYREDKYWVDSYGTRRLSKWPKMVQTVANADQLRVVELGAQHPLFGAEVTLDRVDLPTTAQNRRFSTHYLTEAQLADQTHAFNVEKARLLDVAKKLQARVKVETSGAVEQQRKDAWAAFFKHSQQVISFAHPFAITSHKSQGSTYREVYVNAADLLRFNRRALYVAVTRPSEKLVI